MRENQKSLVVHPTKQNWSRTKKTKPKVRKIKNLSRKKIKTEIKTISINKKTKNTLPKKESNVNKQELSYPVCKGLWKESQIDWTVWKKCSLWVHEDCVVLMKSDFYERNLIWSI